MLQNLCTRAIVPVALAVTGFVVLCCILFYTVFKADLADHAAHQSAALAGTVLKSTRYAMLRDDRETVGNILQNIVSQEGVEHARIFNKEGRVIFSGHRDEVTHLLDETAEGCAGCHSGAVPVAKPELSKMTRRFANPEGAEILAVTAPVYNEPACVGGACHEGLDRRKVLGMLDIGLDQAPQNAALTTLKWRMVAFSLMVLVLTVGGVSALLQHQVFRPVRQLTDFTEKLSNGILDEEFPRNCGELEQLAGHLRRIAVARHASSARAGQGAETGKAYDADASSWKGSECRPTPAGDPGKNP